MCITDDCFVQNMITFTLLQAFCRYLGNEIQHCIMHYAWVQYIWFLSDWFCSPWYWQRNILLVAFLICGYWLKYSDAVITVTYMLEDVIQIIEFSVTVTKLSCNTVRTSMHSSHNKCCKRMYGNCLFSSVCGV